MSGIRFERSLLPKAFFRREEATFRPHSGGRASP